MFIAPFIGEIVDPRPNLTKLGRAISLLTMLHDGSRGPAEGDGEVIEDARRELDRLRAIAEHERQVRIKEALANLLSAVEGHCDRDFWEREIKEAKGALGLDA